MGTHPVKYITRVYSLSTSVPYSLLLKLYHISTRRAYLQAQSTICERISRQIVSNSENKVVLPCMGSEAMAFAFS